MSRCSGVACMKPPVTRRHHSRRTGRAEGDQVLVDGPAGAGRPSDHHRRGV